MRIQRHLRRQQQLNHLLNACIQTDFLFAIYLASSRVHVIITAVVYLENAPMIQTIESALVNFLGVDYRNAIYLLDFQMEFMFSVLIA